MITKDTRSLKATAEVMIQTENLNPHKKNHNFNDRHQIRVFDFLDGVVNKTNMSIISRTHSFI